MSEPALELRDIHRTFTQGSRKLEVLRGASLRLRPGELLALIGPSGAGKSTLLHTAGLLEKPDEGEVLVEGRSCGTASDAERTAIRLRKIGFVYQFHHLLPEFSAVENVMLPQRIAGLRPAEARTRAADLLTRLGLADRLRHRPARLSGGEQQRVAIARAVANDPSVLLADEPTGNLDQETADVVFDALLSLARDHKLAAVIATHNEDLARRMDRILRVQNGILVDV